MNKSVKVTANEAGQVVNISKNNPEYGFIRVAQERTIFEGGWARKKTLSALISGSTEDLKSMGLRAGQEMPGRIIVTESLEPFNAENPEKDYKVAGDTGIICCLDGQPIYRKTFYTEDVSATDTMIAHNNGDAIKAAYAEAEANKSAEGEANL